MSLRDDCRMVIADFPSKHWFVEQEPGFVLQQIQQFYQRLETLGYYDTRTFSTQTE